jgi:hypothetical protein
MSGILEAIYGELQAIRNLLQSQAQQPAQQPVQQPVAQPYVAQPYVAPVQPQVQPAANVTSDSITALIQPHLANAAIKEALGATMRAMGINALPETQPHQYGELYARFQGVIAQHTGAQPAQQPAPVSASII